MKVAKKDNRWTVEVPDEAIRALNVNDGDEVSVRVRGSRVEIVKEVSIEETIERIRQMARPLPSGWKFDREEANKRR